MIVPVVCMLPFSMHVSLYVDDERAAVLDAERRGCQAYEDNNVEGVRAFLMDDYTLTDSRGVVTTKHDDLDDWVSDDGPLVLIGEAAHPFPVSPLTHPLLA